MAPDKIKSRKYSVSMPKPRGKAKHMRTNRLETGTNISDIEVLLPKNPPSVAESAVGTSSPSPISPRTASPLRPPRISAPIYRRYIVPAWSHDLIAGGRPRCDQHLAQGRQALLTIARGIIRRRHAQGRPHQLSRKARSRTRGPLAETPRWRARMPQGGRAEQLQDSKYARQRGPATKPAP